MERAYAVSVIVVTCLSLALSSCPPASCRCEGSDIALCLRSAANCSVLCLQGDYAASDHAVVARDLSLIADGSASVACTGDEGFLSVKGANVAELRGLVVKNCARAVEVSNTIQVRITNTTFWNATGPFAVSVVDCYNVTVEESSFFFSGTSDAERIKSKVSAGVGQTSGSGLSVSLSERAPVGAAIVVSKCSFTGTGNSSEQRRGRGLLVTMVEGTANTTLSVEDCSFVHNSVAAFGGGVYVEVGDDSSGLSISLQSNHFKGNQAVGGGGLGILMHSGSRSNSDVNNLVLFNNTFLSNIADFGGGAFISVAYNGVDGTHILVDQCTFVSNTVFNFIGGALYISSLSSFLTRNSNGGADTSIQPEIRDVTCEANTAGNGGAITLINYPVLFTGRNVLYNNVGPAVRAISTLVSLDGEMYLLGNNAESTGGGALYLSNAQVRVFNGSALVFESNKGSLGAAIVSEPVYINPQFAHLPFNPLCFLLYQNQKNLVNDWKADIVFASNRAQIGSAMYADQLGECAHHGGAGANLHFNSSAALNFEPPFLYSDNTNNRHIDSANSQWQISTPAATFTLQCETGNGTLEDCNTVESFPGQLLTLHIMPLDDIGDPTYGLVSLVQEGGLENDDLVKFVPSLQTIYPDNPHYQFRLQVNPNMQVQKVGVSVQLFSAIASEVEPRKNFTIHITGCLVGNVLSEADSGGKYQTCKCVLGADSAILKCDLDRESLVLKDGLWGTAGQGHLTTIPCPPGYCRCNYTVDTDVMEDNTITSVCSSAFNLSQPDTQCACSRQGYLCGACRSGMSVTAVLNTCTSCDNTWIVGIVMLILVDAIVIASVSLLPMIVPRFHFPSALYSLTFYIQLSPYATANYPVTYGYFHQGLKYLGSLLGLYYPFDACLFNGATALDAFALRYIPFLLAAVISPLAIGLMWWISHRSTTFSIGNHSTTVKVNYNGVWFVWMLILNDVLATSFAILDRPSNNTQVWYYDGTVPYFAGGHAALAFWAIVVMATLLLAVLYILLVMYFSEQLKFARVIRKIRETVVIGFVEEYPFWFAVDFIRRFIFIAVITYEKDGETIAVFVLAAYFCLYSYLKPYKVFTDNVFELLLLGNFLALVMLRSVVYIRDVLRDIVVTPSSTDCSGWAIAKPSDFAIVLGVLYYLPVFYTALPVIVSILKCHSERLKRLVKRERRRTGRDPKKKSGGASVHYTVTTLRTPVVARRVKAVEDDFDSKAELLLMSTHGSGSLPSLD